ncbi:hypothetical protein LCGC14_0356000 [marine sediment metagenome]|uniref:Uncharacterized protein n=1 Tax=marine sediment metagenome TaxID=412755 RepID=A0A0F9WHK5_9ZZZZ
MKQFEVKECHDIIHNWYIDRGTEDYMHRDGEIVHGAVEYWPTREQAQAVLDKFQPPHVWEHGDVFRWIEPIGDGSVMVYLIIDAGPVVYTLVSEPEDHVDYHPAVACPEPVKLLENATFLFNIREKFNANKS